jgi:hypothetical protein
LTALALQCLEHLFYGVSHARLKMDNAAIRIKHGLMHHLG